MEGSPPRMRETHCSPSISKCRCRITPAYAGNTILLHQFLHKFKDHPRVCGKHFLKRSLTLPSLGSPPRMRETLAARMISRSRMRITPAYAGNTIYQIFKVCKIRDHPRVCGKHLTTFTKSRTAKGSPPRMRETLQL